MLFDASILCFPTSNILSVQRWAVAVMAHGLMVGILFPSWVPSRLTFWGGCNVIIWWLQQSLYTDLAGDIFHSCFQIPPYHKPSTLYFYICILSSVFSFFPFWNKKHHSRTKALSFTSTRKYIYISHTLFYKLH